MVSNELQGYYLSANVSMATIVSFFLRNGNNNSWSHWYSYFRYWTHHFSFDLTIYPSTNLHHDCLTSVIRQDLVKPCHWLVAISWLKMALKSILLDQFYVIFYPLKKFKTFNINRRRHFLSPWIFSERNMQQQWQEKWEQIEPRRFNISLSKNHFKEMTVELDKTTRKSEDDSFHYSSNSHNVSIVLVKTQWKLM